MAETVLDIVAAHRAGSATPSETVARTYARIRAHADPAIFITLREEAEVLAEARALEAAGKTDLPLYGVPFAVKDNIDVAGLPTTAACPAFSFKPTHDATAVARLRAAGALVIGKTNLDQFATGLVGVRSPYGIPRNTFDPELVPGGSSSGSATSVAAGLVPFSLGTDTAGSGRVPAGLNNIVGLKPSLGLISTHGLVPACRTLDCISIFALTVDDAWHALSVAAGYDAADSYSRHRSAGHPGAMPMVKLGVPIPGQRIFFGDKDYEAGYGAALDSLARLGCDIIEIDVEPFYETARLLYEGPWVAERTITAQKLLASDPDAIHPVTKEITIGGLRPTAMDAFAAFYKLERLRRVSDYIFANQIDALAMPTAPTTYTVKQVLADPIQLNSRLGTYTNFVNLLDLCGLALPASLTSKGLPFGITLLAAGGKDARLAEIGRVFHADTQLPLGALKMPQPPLSASPVAAADDEIAVAVVGAHLSGLPLNGDLRSLGARLIEATKTAPDYKFYALNGTVPPKPGLLRVDAGKGSAVEVEVWALPKTAFGTFIDGVGAPLSIGTVVLADGRGVKGFLMEAAAVAGASDISSFSGWRKYLASLSSPGLSR